MDDNKDKADCRPDPQALRKLVEALLPEVSHCAHRDFNGQGSEVVGRWSLAASQLLSSGRLAEYEDPRVVLMRVYQNEKNDELKRLARRRNNVSLDEATHSTHQAALALEQLIQKEQYSRFLQHIAKLDDTDQKVLQILRDPQFDNWSGEQIASHLSMTHDGYRKRKQRLQVKLREEERRCNTLEMAIGQIPNLLQRQLLRWKHIEGLCLSEMVERKDPALGKRSPEREGFFARLLEAGEKELPPELLAGQP